MRVFDEEIGLRNGDGRELVLATGFGQDSSGRQSVHLCLFHGDGEDERLLFDWDPDEAAEIDGASALVFDDYQGGLVALNGEELAKFVDYVRRVSAALEGPAFKPAPRRRLGSLAG